MAKAGRVSPVQVGVLIVGLIAVGYLVVTLTRTDRVVINTEIMLADVVTGQLYKMDTARRSAFIPEVNPDTGKETLFPVMQDEAGNWVLSPNHREGVRRLSEKPTAVADLRSGRVSVSGEGIRVLQR